MNKNEQSANYVSLGKKGIFFSMINTFIGQETIDKYLIIYIKLIQDKFTAGKPSGDKIKKVVRFG